MHFPRFDVLFLDSGIIRVSMKAKSNPSPLLISLPLYLETKGWNRSKLGITDGPLSALRAPSSSLGSTAAAPYEPINFQMATKPYLEPTARYLEGKIANQCWLFTVCDGEHSL